MLKLRRRTRRKRTKAMAATAAVEEERLSTRVKKRREIIPSHHIPLPSAGEMDPWSIVSGVCSDDSKLQIGVTIQLLKLLSVEENPLIDELMQSGAVRHLVEFLTRKEPRLQDLSSMESGVRSDDGKLQLDATTQFLKLLSVEENPLMDEVIQSGAVPRLVEFLMRDDYPQLQCEAARVLKNIASGTSEQTKMVIDYGAVPVFVKLLESLNLETREQATWALGNIAGDSPKYRDIVLNCGALHPLLTLLNEHNELSFLRIATWTLSNFLEGEPEHPIEQLEPTIPILTSIIQTNDEEVLKEACWGLLYLSQICGGRLKSAMVEADICFKLGKVLRQPSQSVLLPALRALASIVKGSDPLDQRPLGAWHFVHLLFFRNDLCSCIVKEASSLTYSFEDRFSDIRNKMMEEKRRIRNEVWRKYGGLTNDDFLIL